MWFSAFFAILPLAPLASSARVPQDLFQSSFDVSTHLGNLSPYAKAPAAPGLQETLPEDCTVDQVMLVRHVPCLSGSHDTTYLSEMLICLRFKQMQRHGSRYPLVSELVFITNLVSKLAGSSAAIKKAELPSSMEFLKDGYTSTLGHDDLTAPGRLQLFDHGVSYVWFATG